MAKLTRYSVKGPTEGLDYRVTPKHEVPRGAAALTNMAALSGDILGKRPGTTVIGELTDPIMLIDQFRLASGVVWLIVVTTKAIWGFHETWQDLSPAGGLTGTVDDPVSCVQMYNWFIIANGVDPLLKWDGTGVFRQVGTSPQYAKIVAKYKERLFGISYVNEPLQISWTVPGTLDDWSGIGSGSGLLSGGTDKILNAKLLGQVLMIYKEDESYMCSYIGGTQYFRFDQAVVGNGIVAAKSLVEFQSRHAYLGNDNIYLYEGGRVVAPIGDAVQHEMFSQLAPSQIGRSFSFVRGDENEAWFVVPSLDSDGPSVAWVYNYSLQRWFRHDISITAAGLWKAPTDVSYGKASGTYAEQALRFGDSIYKTSAPLVVLGTIDGKVLQLDQGSYNDSSTLPIVEIFDTPVISIPVESSTENVRRWLGVSADVRGASISCYYKVEEDGEWTLAGTASPGTYWQKVQFDIDVSSQYLWLRFSASGLSTWFDIRGYEVHYLRRRSEG